MRRKTLILPILMGVVLLAMAGCSDVGAGGGSGRVGGTLVIYTPNEEGMLDALIPVFEEEYGARVEVTTAGTGELFQRIRSEAANPQGDVMFGGSGSQAAQNQDLFAEHVSSNNAAMIEAGKNTTGFTSFYQADGSNLLVNIKLVKELGIEIEGYKDLLKPELKGRIAFGDPTQSSSAFAQLTNMLLAVGGDYDSNEGWDYVKDLVEQLDGVSIGSSSQVAQDVANGEFVVGLTYEPLSLNFVQSGSPVKIVYPVEGAVFLPAGVSVIKNGPNPQAAEAFADFMTSERGQTILARETAGRPLRDGIVKDGLPALSEIKTLDEDGALVSEKRDAIVAQYTKVLEGR